MSWVAGKKRRWQPAVAIIAALSVFIALVAGSSLRPQFSAAQLPEPAAWSHNTADVGAPAAHHSAHAVAEIHSPHSTPLKKPFHSMWMTHDRPASWTRMAPQSPWPATPISVTVSGFQPRGTQCDARANPHQGQDLEDILTLLCVARC